MCPTCPARRGPCATWACSARWRVRSRISRRRCASSPGPTVNDAEAAPVPLGPSPALKAKDLRIAVRRKQSAGQGVGRHGCRRASDRAAAHQGRRQGEACRARRARLAAGLGRLVRSLPVPGPRPAAARRARAHFRHEPMQPDPSARSTARTARLDLAEFFAVLDRRDRIMRQCEIVPRRLRRLADAGDAGRRLHPPEAERAARASTASPIPISSPARPTTSSPT